MTNTQEKNKGPWFQLLLLTLVTAGLSVVMLEWVGDDSAQTEVGELAEYQRIVSLTPAMTDTLVALGASGKLVGISDYCSDHDSLKNSTRVGTGLTPNYEAIVRLQPDLIVLETTKQGDYKKLEAISETRAFPWLTLDEVVASVQEFGTLTGNISEGRLLGEKLRSGLTSEPSQEAPRVLLLLGLSSFDGGSLWFIKQNSLHGAALRAAGARNAVARDVAGAPSMSMEELLKVDPDIILTLVSQPDLSKEDEAVYRERMAELGVLKAVQTDKVGFVVGQHYMGTGPVILEFVDALKLELKRLSWDS